LLDPRATSKTAEFPMKPDRQKLQADLLQFVQSRGPRYAAVTPDTDLLDGGLLDSLLLTDLILHIEGLHGIEFDSGHVSPANFRTVSAIVGLVREQFPAPPPPPA
jgi:acyl carrier protein